MEKLAQTQSSQDTLDPIFNITQAGFQELMKASLTLDQLFYLECLRFRVDIKDLVSKDKILTWRQSLVRKGLVTEAGVITSDGTLLLNAVGSGQPFTGSLEKRKESADEEFEKWWKAFPSSDIFAYRGRKFTGSRAMKLKKENCREVYNKILNEGNVTAVDLLRSLEYEVLLKKEESLKTGENKLKFMTNTLSYLGGRLYEGFLETSKEELSINNQSFEDI